MPAVYRGAPINSIWEGSGNVAALDVLRALGREPEAVAAFRAECELGRGANRWLDAQLDGLDHAEVSEYGARRVVEDMALALQGSLLVRFAPAAVADAFCVSRLGGQGGRAYGTLPAGVDAVAIIDRALLSG
jgi:putative acyl-CoA dehydrogenase